HAAHAARAGLPCRFLRALGELVEEALAARAALVEALVAAAAVEPHGRGADEDLRTLLGALELAHEEARGLDAAADELALAPLVEAAGGDALAREVHEGPGAVHEARVDGAAGGVPAVRRPEPAAQGPHGRALAREPRRERPPDEAGGPRDGDRPAHRPSVRAHARTLAKFRRAWE